MEDKKAEELLIRSFDQELTTEEQKFLEFYKEAHPTLDQEALAYKKLRETMRRKRGTTFGPFFSQKVINKLQDLRKEIDHQIIFFFKKYQLAGLGVIVALLAFNAIFADTLSFQSLLGIVNETPIQEIQTEEQQLDDIVTMDFLEQFNEEL